MWSTYYSNDSWPWLSEEHPTEYAPFSVWQFCGVTTFNGAILEQVGMFVLLCAYIQCSWKTQSIACNEDAVNSLVSNITLQF